MSYIKNAIRNELRTPLTLTATVIALVNFFIPISREKGVDIVIIKDISLNFKSIELAFIILIILEAVLGNVFGKIIVYLESYGDGVSRIILFAVALTSAWLSIFNVDWLITDTLVNSYNWEGGSYASCFSIIAIIVISIYLISYHGSKLHNCDDYLDDRDYVVWIQVVAFVIMLILGSITTL